MPDPLSINPRNDDVLAAPVAGPVRMAMADVPPEVPPSGRLPPGKTKPGEFLLPMREPLAEQGGAPRAPEVVRPTAKDLTEALGKDAFMGHYNNLKGLSREELVALANEFNGPLRPSASKKDALERIFSRHRRLREFLNTHVPTAGM